MRGSSVCSLEKLFNGYYALMFNGEGEAKMQRLIRSLKSKSLIAECPKCGDEFPLSKALLFDGTEPFPEEAEDRRRKYEEDLKLQYEALKLRKRRAEIDAARTTEAVRIGQMLENIVPSFDQFQYQPTDCRPLFDPIDILVFKGLSKNKIRSVTFMEIKTGGGRLNPHQRQIRDAIDDGRVFYGEV